MKWWETETVCKFSTRLVCFITHFLVSTGVCTVYSYTPKLKTLLTDMAVDMSFKWNVKIRSFFQPFFYHFCDVHKVLIKSEALYQWAVGHQQLWVKEAQGTQSKIQIDDLARVWNSVLCIIMQVLQIREKLIIKIIIMQKKLRTYTFTQYPNLTGVKDLINKVNVVVDIANMENTVSSTGLPVTL